MGVTVNYSAPDTFDMVKMGQLIDAAVRQEARRASSSRSRTPTRSARAIQKCRRGRHPGDLRELRLRRLREPRHPDPRRPGRDVAGQGGRREAWRPPASRTPSASTRRSATPASTPAATASPKGLGAGGKSTVLQVDLKDPTTGAAEDRRPPSRPTRRSTASWPSARPAPTPALAALEAAGQTGKIKLGTFDLSPDVLAGDHRRHDGLRHRPAAVPPGLPADRVPHPTTSSTASCRAAACRSRPARASSPRTTSPPSSRQRRDHPLG